MTRVRLQCDRPSKSAVALSRALNIKRLKRTNSKFRPRSTDIILNWGVVDTLPNAQYLNSPQAVSIAADKLATFRALDSKVSIPEWSTSLPESDDVWVARTTLYGHSGEGIVVGTPDTLPSAPLYTRYISKVAEYRAIVINSKVVDFKQKLRKRDQSEDNPEGFSGERNEHVWNHGSGYVFARNGIRHPETANTLAIDALNSIDLTYGAVDIIEDSEGTLYILEINTKFGNEGATLDLVAEAFKELLCQ